MSDTAAKVAYKPVGLIAGLIGGAIAGSMFRQLWTRVADEQQPPKALQQEYPWKEILLMAAIQGAIVAVVRAAVNRGGAEAVRKVTGTWPGD